jgi:hypothetical protein
MLAAFSGRGSGSVAIIDSPRWPRDLDWSRRHEGITPIVRPDPPPGRDLDRALRALIRRSVTANAEPIRLSMFPTPRLDYFTGCVTNRECKPHLRTIYGALFGRLPATSTDGRISGGTFTRFMLCGFVAYVVLEQMGVKCYECFPDVQFRLLGQGGYLPPKRKRTAALRERLKILDALYSEQGIAAGPRASTLDQADAAVMVLAGLRPGSLVSIRNPAEGEFIVAFRDSPPNPLPELVAASLDSSSCDSRRALTASTAASP